MALPLHVLCSWSEAELLVGVEIRVEDVFFEIEESFRFNLEYFGEEREFLRQGPEDGFLVGALVGFQLQVLVEVNHVLYDLLVFEVEVDLFEVELVHYLY